MAKRPRITLAELPLILKHERHELGLLEAKVIHSWQEGMSLPAFQELSAKLAKARRRLARLDAAYAEPNSKALRRLNDNA